VVPLPVREVAAIKQIGKKTPRSSGRADQNKKKDLWRPRRTAGGGHSETKAGNERRANNLGRFGFEKRRARESRQWLAGAKVRGNTWPGKEHRDFRGGGRNGPAGGG